KPINRPIEGVIKADDEASLKLEVEEYVLTNEVARRLETFLAAYTHYEGANGVWVSGFFGSGKSHLLKTLALLLENRVIDGVPVLDLFLPKCGDNEILRGDLKRAVAIPSKSILFNIDQKADIISKTQVDALLAVFVKVFDEMCGYYGKQGHIAQFERDLDSRGLYDAFREAFRARSGLSWEAGREQALLEAHHIAEAYAQVTGVPEATASGILDKYRSQYRVSIEDFAEQVAAYIARQGPDFRLNFFVDEVGQYIAENTKLMTNLQTIAESLATKCRGRAWLVVTAQEDMETVVGEMSQQKGNDFSKIQARFSNRMKLTSTDVAEVIRRRLLLKNERGIVLLSDVYADQQNNLRTLFGFGDGAPTYRSFRNRDDFIHTYPFIPYQFVLFQSAIQNLSVHNAFEGKHSSVGERSMLGVFQQVAMRVAGQEIGQLATFDLMFEGVRTALKANIQRAVLNAEQQLDNPLAIQVLKALFLVKYIKEFKATVRNLSVLMLDRFDADVAARSRQLQE
ncbi:MAG: BREX system P-loop protein BrxC, partial [Anaerolineae bacterium]